MKFRKDMTGIEMSIMSRQRSLAMFRQEDCWCNHCKWERKYLLSELLKLHRERNAKP